MKEEIFRPIRGYEGLYEISNHGRVKSLPKSWGKDGRSFGVKGETELMAHKMDNGYPRIVLCKDSIKRAMSVHRLVAEAFIENPNNYPVVNHRNSIKSDNYFENLEWTTYKGNAIHAFENGRRSGRKGMAHHHSKYSDMDIRVIRKLYSDGKYSQQEIADMFEDYQSNISRIILKKRWSHIK